MEGGLGVSSDILAGSFNPQSPPDVEEHHPPSFNILDTQMPRLYTRCEKRYMRKVVWERKFFSVCSGIGIAWR